MQTMYVIFEWATERTRQRTLPYLTHDCRADVHMHDSPRRNVRKPALSANCFRISFIDHQSHISQASRLSLDNTEYMYGISQSFIEQRLVEKCLDDPPRIALQSSTCTQTSQGSRLDHDWKRRTTDSNLTCSTSASGNQALPALCLHDTGVTHNYFHNAKLCPLFLLPRYA